MAQDERRWTLEELAGRVATALAEGSYEGAPNARVRDVPDERVIRYYTTLGLVDRPTYEGRVAKYGGKHLKQIVAIKRLQSEGLSLSHVQERLAGLAPAALTRLARVPEEAEGAQAAARAVRRGPPSAGGLGAEPPRARFWAAPPAEPPKPSLTPTSSLAGVPIAEGVTVLLGLARPLSEEDVEALQSAAEPLLAMLRKRGMIRRGEGR